MNGQQVIQRLQAYQAGKPLPHYETLHFPIVPNPDLLILSFVRMGGESAPWGIAAGHPGHRPTLFTVPEPRNRDLRADMVAKFTPILLKHFYHPALTSLEDQEDLETLPLRQIWLPNPSHLEMLDYMSYAYTFTKWGEPSRAQALNRVGRLAGWLFRESQRPGQITTITATEALKTSYIFPAQDIRQSHLGFLLAWLTTSGSGEKRAAAGAAAERVAISTSLDPVRERDRLESEVDQYNQAVKQGQTKAASTAAQHIREELEGELIHRYNLTEAAIQALRQDKRRANKGLATLVDVSRKELWYRYLRGEVDRELKGDDSVYTPSPETDRHPLAAAAQYYLHAASEETRLAALLQDDTALQDEAIAAGDAFRGVITAITDEGTGKSCKPIWTITSSLTLTRLRVGSCLCVAGLPSREVRVRSLDSLPDGSIVLEVEVTALKTRPKGPAGAKVPLATDRSLIGKQVTLLPMASEGIGRLKAQKVWAQGTPGSWLTTRRPGGQRAALPTEVAENLGSAGVAL